MQKKIILSVIKVNMKNKARVPGLDRITNWVVISDGVSAGGVLYQAGNWGKPLSIIVLRKEILYTNKKNLYEHIGYE